MDISFLGEGELPEILDQMISDSIEISIASAFLNFKGVSLLKKYLKKYGKIKKIQMLLDEDFHQDDAVKKKLLSELSRLPNTEVRIFCDKKRLFHAKIYCFRGAEKVKVVVGSSNLTAGGLFHNIEMNVLFETDPSNPEIQKLNKIYNEHWKKSIPSSDYIRDIGGDMSTENFRVGDKVTIGQKADLGIGKIVDIEGDQADIFFKEKGLAETAHVNDIELAYEPFDMAKGNRFDEPQKFDLRTKALYLPIANKNGILSNSIIEILPHQVLASHKVVTSESRRFLLADEVGLGKTFEAGIIIRELYSRWEADRVLIITPAGLVEQWQEDMAKFNMDYTIYRSGMETAIKDFWNKMNTVITSIDTIKQEGNLETLFKGNDWDVIVVDEAHHLTRKDYGPKADKSERYVVGEKLKDRTKALLFLTATPHQGDRNKFYNLVNLLDEELFDDDFDLFQNREKLENLMIRQRKIDVTDENGNPIFVKRIVNTLNCSMSDAEKRFFNYLNLYLTTGYKISEQDSSSARYRALGFVMTTFQKLATSSIFAVKTALQKRLIRLLFIEIEKTKDEIIIERNKREIVELRKNRYTKGENDDDIYSLERNEFEKYIKKENIDPAESIATPDEIEKLKELLSYVPDDMETKLVELLENIKTIREKDFDEKVIIFTEYLNTQDYIVDKLKEVYGDKDVVRIRGGDQQEKTSAAKEFKKSAHFLVSTQAGGEGINLQHCHILINYDMPWNPMKVEQRIGRIHRYKAKDTAQVYNMFAKDTIEDRIYQRLDDKLYEITQTIGNDDEREAYRENILGIIAEELNFDELYKEVLKKGQEVDEITKDKIDAAIERAEEVYKKLGDFTQDLEQFNLDKYFKTRGDVSLMDVENFVKDFVRSEGKKLSEDEEGYYEFIVPEIIPVYAGQKYRKVTFNRDLAVEDPSINFMAIGHHITDSIIDKCSGYGYGGRCSKRHILNTDQKGGTGIQCNYLVEYQAPQPGTEKNRMLRKELHMLMFDQNCEYRDEWKDLAIIDSEKKYRDDDFVYANRVYLEEVEEAAEKKIKQLIDETIEELREKNPNVIYKKNLENIALFSIN